MDNKGKTTISYNEKLEKKNRELSEQLEMSLEQIQYLQEQLFALQRQMYGRKKENTPYVDGQTNLFDSDPFKEPEPTGQESQETIKVKPHKRKKLRDKKRYRLPTYQRIIFIII